MALVEDTAAPKCRRYLHMFRNSVCHGIGNKISAEAAQGIKHKYQLICSTRRQVGDEELVKTGNDSD